MATADDHTALDGSLPQAKPPFLRRVQIRNFKSIAFCDVTLEPLTLLVGRNGAGKSNFLQAIGFLRDLTGKYVNEVVTNHGGWSAIHNRFSTSPTIEFEIEGIYEFDQKPTPFDYRITINESKDKNIVIRSEFLSIDGETCFSAPEIESEPSITSRFLGLLGTPNKIAKHLLFAFWTSQKYSFDIHGLKILRPIGGAGLLNPDGLNLAQAIASIEATEPETWERIQQYLSAIVPEVESFHRIQYSTYETIRFHMKPHNGLPAQEFDAASMSDGTLRVLATLVAAFQHKSSNPHSRFIGIEEPETALHPAAMRALVDALDEATLRTQIILTTHSSEILDAETIRPENIRFVQMIDGKTVISTIDEASKTIVDEKLSTLGELERNDQLEANFDDVARQARLAEESPKEPS